METASPLLRIIDAYESNFLAVKEKIRLDPDDCVPWFGPTRMPTREGGARVPTIIDGNDVYDAAKIGFAVYHRLGSYPMGWYNMSCQNLWCVRGDHVHMYEHSRSGRATKSLETTRHFDARYDYIRGACVKKPDITFEEVLRDLQRMNIGGKAITVSRILSKVRAELGLPGRVSRKRTKVTF